MIKIRDIRGDVIHSVEGDSLIGANLIRADLRDAELSNANLTRANLTKADMSGARLVLADLSFAELFGANLIEANLSNANIYKADLSAANLSRANLTCTLLANSDLSYANLSGANLDSARLMGANLRNANLVGSLNINEIEAAEQTIVPEGELIVWKKCRDNVLVKLRIPELARRSNSTGRKCRAEFAQVIEVFGEEFGISERDDTVIYRVGETVHCDKWCEDRWQECGGGIHFFLTRAEARNY